MLMIIFDFLPKTTGEDSYAGWFKSACNDGTLVYRLGYLHPTTEHIRGLGVTNISTATASSVWHSNVFAPNAIGWYQVRAVCDGVLHSSVVCVRTGV
jgi:hypothetical protein